MYNISKSALKEVAGIKNIYFIGLSPKEIKNKILSTYPPHDFVKGEPVTWVHSSGKIIMFGFFVSAYIHKKTGVVWAKLKVGKRIHIKKLKHIEHVKNPKTEINHIKEL